MARPPKRPAQSDSDDDDLDQDSIPSDDNSSTPPSGTRKRRRISDGVSENGRRTTDSTSPSDYDSAGDEEEEIAATQAIRQKRAQQQGNEPAECGILVNVELQNFMCHGSYLYDLGPLINFICGRNGSGKSAILTAIVLCLGGKASATNRGMNLKSFIKEGQDNAKIICRIKNEGDGAFMPEEYGSIIEIERYFSRTGAPGFKIRSQSGRLVSTKKSTLEDICDHFALQIDNPLNVLSQDMARQFIASSNASEKYKFFVKGVQLEQLDSDYRIIEDQLERIEANIETKKPDIKILEQRMMRAKAKDEAMKKHNGLREKVRELRRQLCWVQVQVQEDLLAEYGREVDAADQGILEAEGRVEELNQVFQASDQANNRAVQAYEQAQAAVQAAQEEIHERKAQYDEAKQETNNAQSELRTIKSALTQADQTIKKKKEEIVDEERRLTELTGGGAAERLRQLEKARDNQTEAEQSFLAHQRNKGGLDADLSNWDIELRMKKEAVNVKKVETDRREQSLNEIMRNRGSQDLAFDPKMPALLAAVQKETRFQSRPIGPLGKHMRLLKPEWSSVLEKSFGSSLGSFIVTSKRDSDLLLDLAKRVGCRANVSIGNNSPIDTTGKEPAPEFLTPLRAIEIDNEMVRKQLIIAHNIEKTILVPDLEEASNIMYSQGRLQNVQRCYCLNPYNKRNGFVLSYTRNGDPSQDPIAEWVGRPRMKTDIEVQIRDRRDAVDEAKASLHRLETDLHTAQSAVVKARQAVEKHKRDSRTLQLNAQAAADEVNRLEDVISEDRVEGGRMEALRQALKEAEESLAVHEASYKDSVVNLDVKKAHMKGLSQQYNKTDERVKEVEQARDRAKAQNQKTDKKRAYDLGEKNNAIARVDDAKQDRTALEARRAEKEIKVGEYITAATNICSRVNLPEGATYESLEEQHKKLKSVIERHENALGGTAEQIVEEAKRTTIAYKEGLKDMKVLESMNGQLRDSLVERRERWKKFRSHISVRAKAQFTYLLSERSFRGRLVTDHKQKLLELSVEPDITKRDGQGRSARTLSGGEKSFSQICLLLSIWEAMGSPIRCLDEFDVYMDAVNRNLSVNLLIEAARQSAGRQFVLISPGSKSDIQQGPDVKAQEIAAPERGQQTIAFTRV